VKTMNRFFLYLLIFLVLSIGVGTSILVHHYLNWGRVIDIEDVLHHEFFASIAFSFSAGIIATILLLRGHGKNG